MTTEGRGAASGYSWPPFEAGNVAALKHGATSPRTVAAKAAEVRAQLLEQFAYLAEDIFAESVERYCRAEARAVLLHDHIERVAAEQGVEAVRPYLWQEAARAEGNAQKFASDCGLDPAGHARIARDLGVARSIGQKLAGDSLVSFAAEGRKLRQLRAREA